MILRIFDPKAKRREGEPYIFGGLVLLSWLRLSLLWSPRRDAFPGDQDHRFLSVRIYMLAALLAVHTLAACEHTPPSISERRPEHAIGSAFESGTVGEAASKYVLTMTAVRVWYAIVGQLRSEAERTGTSISLDFPLEGGIDAQARQVEAMPLLRTVLLRRGMTPRQFVIVTTAVGAVRLSLTLVDSLGPAGRPTNIGQSVSDFARLHRREIDSLDASLRP